jgi:hypothetical protein
LVTLMLCFYLLNAVFKRSITEIHKQSSNISKSGCGFY